MYKVAKLKKEDRKDLFDKYIADFGGTPAIVEKDFWVSLMLDYLFNKCKYKDSFVFKGGTSLSKCFNIINRFSEDIDLTLDYKLLGISKNKLYEDRSNNAQKKYVENLKLQLNTFIRDKLKPCLEKDFEEILGNKPVFVIDKNEIGVLNFYYPNVYDVFSTGILQCIRLEIGALAELTPNVTKEISPLIASMNNKFINRYKFKVKTISPEKTFWEKVLILHQEANRPLTKIENGKEVVNNIPKRYSRHYYDVYKFSQTKYKNSAKEDKKLLKQIIEFRNKFYHYSWSKLNDALNGSLKLVPSKERIKELSKDFTSMKEMINDKDIKSFDDLIDKLKALEKELNNKK